MQKEKPKAKDIKFEFKCSNCKEPIRCICGAEVKDLETIELLTYESSINFCTHCGKEIANDFRESLTKSQDEFVKLWNDWNTH